MLIWTSDEGLAVLRHQGTIFVDALSVAFLQHCTMHYHNGMGRSISTVCALCVGASDRQIRLFFLRPLLWNISSINERNLQVTFIAAIKNNEEYYSNMMRFLRSGSMELPKTKNEF
ncbi:hypothetical protein MXB_1478 [Myxobolus squamalis]|nr:hypothetical protein MXB_1478 [Myxobolus squamalis]